MKHIFIFIALAISLSGCATAPTVATMYPLPPPTQEGIYHTVLEGETLWRIAKSYNVDISKIVQANRLQDPSKITKGQMLFIPRLDKRADAASGGGEYAEAFKGFVWPVDGVVVSCFGQKSYNMVNSGIDILSKKDADVIASLDGVVSFCDDKVKGFGKTIIIDHNNGYSTVYAYNSQNFVNAGDRVNKGNVIAKVGKSARSDSYMLHFEIRKNKKPVNPFYYLP